MKRIYIIISVVIIVCGSLFYFIRHKNNSLEHQLQKAKQISQYEFICDMDLLQNDELKSYEVTVDCLNHYYKVRLYDKSINQSQVIVKNKQGVYVLTPTLNQSFKFQSDWPMNSPKPYIYQSLISFLEKNKVEKIKDGYRVVGKITYPNDQRIVKQEIMFDKHLKPQRIACLDKDETELIVVKTKSFQTNTHLTKDDFNPTKTLKKEKKNIQTTNNDVMYPTLTFHSKLESETVATIDSNQHILKFTGNKSFTLIESMIQHQNNSEIIDGKAIDLVDGFVYYQKGKMTMMNSGVMCTLYSQELTKKEMLAVLTSLQTSSTK